MAGAGVRRPERRRAFRSAGLTFAAAVCAVLTTLPFTLHFGFALVEAIIIAIVMLIGGAFAFARRFEDGLLALAAAYKSVLFCLLVMLFNIAERLVVGWFHHKGPFGGWREIADVGIYEIGARMLMLTMAFVPFFALREVGRVLGMQRQSAMFFARPHTPAADPPRPA
jgi:hypothetical protein